MCHKSTILKKKSIYTHNLRDLNDNFFIEELQWFDIKELEKLLISQPKKNENATVKMAYSLTEELKKNIKSFATKTQIKKALVLAKNREPLKIEGFDF